MLLDFLRFSLGFCMVFLLIRLFFNSYVGLVVFLNAPVVLLQGPCKATCGLIICSGPLPGWGMYDVSLLSLLSLSLSPV